MENKRSKCILCETRPTLPHSQYCGQCNQRIDSETDARDSRKVSARYFITYRELVVGLYPNGEDETGQPIYKGRREHLDTASLPTSRTINLDTYLDGYTREQIKRLKAKVLSLS